MPLCDPRGGELREASWQVKSLRGARTWYPQAVASDLPVTIETATATSGRLHVRVLAASGRELMRRG